MVNWKCAILVLLGGQAIVGADAAEHRVPGEAPAAVFRTIGSGSQFDKAGGAMVPSALDRVAFAVDGAESSHGKDRNMWHPYQSGPQGPMQVSEAAATDVGSGDRFDIVQNRAIGRSYLAQLYRHYGDWPDTIAAYNWGQTNVNAWINAGRPTERLLTGVAAYMGRVLHQSGVCSTLETTPFVRTGSDTKPLTGQANIATLSICAHLDVRGSSSDGNNRSVRKAILVTENRPVSSPSSFQQKVASARISWVLAIQRFGCATTSNNSIACK